jgi:hypothetical protein
MRFQSLAWAILTLPLVACGASDHATNAEDSNLEGAGQSADVRLNALFFDDADTKERIAYVLVGHLPNSKEACSVTISRRGLHPEQNDTSMVTIHPFGKSAKTIEEHGPVDISFLSAPGFTSAKSSLDVQGSTAVYALKSKKDEGENIALTLHFADGKKPRFDAIASASIDGTTVVGHQAAACEGLATLIVLHDNELETLSTKTKDQFAKDHGEDLSDMDFEGCDVTTPKRLHCLEGNETNEETLELTFEIAGGKVGRLLASQRHSDF